MTVRRPADVSVHEWHHRRIAETKAEYLALPRRGDVAKHERREAGKRAWWTLTGHMRSYHGYSRAGYSYFLGKTYADVEAMHEQKHRESE